MLIDDVWEQLRRYGDEMGLTGGLTLAQLMESHRTLRTAALQSNDERQREIAVVRQRAAEAARQEVLHGEYVSVERLGAMTVVELAGFVGERCLRT
jgi:hypothetical protein